MEDNIYGVQSGSSIPGALGISTPNIHSPFPPPTLSEVPVQPSMRATTEALAKTKVLLSIAVSEAWNAWDGYCSGGDRVGQTGDPGAVPPRSADHLTAMCDDLNEMNNTINVLQALTERIRARS